MSLEISEREKEGIIILDLKGLLTAGAGAMTLRDSLRARLGDEPRNIVLNMAQVEYIDSTGLGAMVMCFTGSRKAGGRLVLLNLNRRHLELLVLTKLSTIFEIFDDEQQAINSYFPNRQIKQFDILSFIEQQREQDAD